MKAFLLRNNTLILLVGLCLLCIGGGFQSATAVSLWLDESAGRPSSPKLWSETLKAAALLLYALVVFVRVALVLNRGNDLPPAGAGSRRED